MSKKFKNTYRIASHRKPGWDYSSDGMYFITLVTQNRVCNLGEIVDTRGRLVDTHGRVVDTHGRAYPLHGRAYPRLSDYGKIVDAEWKKSFEIRTELFLDEYIIMPNHLHAIVVINNDKQKTVVESQSQSQSQPFYRLPKSISSFLAGFKSAVNSKIDDYIDQHNLNIPKYNRKNHFFQPNYHDHIIRNEQSYQTISEYIIYNPAKWADDKFYTI